MGPLNLLLLGVGLTLGVLGYLRARTPWRRYQALKAEDANIARYEAWRGGVRSDNRSGASVAMQMLRRQAQIGAGIMAVGFACIVLAFLV